MKYTIYYKDKWEKKELRQAMLLYISHQIVFILVLKYCILGIRRGTFSFNNEFDVVVLILLFVETLFLAHILTELFGKEEWCIDDNAISIRYVTLGVVLRIRKWDISNIRNVKYIFTPLKEITPDEHISGGSFTRSTSSNGGPHYELYFSLSNPQKTERVFWSGRPGLAEKLYSHIKLILDNKPKNIQLDFDKYDFFD